MGSLDPLEWGGPAGAQNSNVYIKTLIRNSYTWARGRKRGARVRGVREALNGNFYIKTFIRNAYTWARGEKGSPGGGGSRSKKGGRLAVCISPPGYGRSLCFRFKRKLHALRAVVFVVCGKRSSAMRNAFRGRGNFLLLLPQLILICGRISGPGGGRRTAAASWPLFFPAV